MCYLYLPIKLPGQKDWHSFLEPRLMPFAPLIEACEAFEGRSLEKFYLFLTVKHLFVSPGNVGNRPGWHTDSFGGEDINFIWTNKFPTLFSKSNFVDISDDHTVSMKQFDEQARPEDDYSFPVNSLLRLDPFVVHGTPKTVTPGMRTFFKLSIGLNPYNLKGNSKNPLLPTTWKMFEREEVRNDPIRKERDFVSL
jgi:hypothetical protein